MSLFKYKLWRAKRAMSPTLQFKRALLKRLKQELAPVSSGWFRLGIIKWSAAALAGVVVASSIGTGTYAYSSPQVAEGSKLYPLKRKIESIEERFHRHPEGKAKFYLRQIKRREAEHKRMECCKKIDKDYLEKAKLHIKKAEDRLEQVESRLEKSNNIELKQKIRSRLEKRKKILNKKRQHLEALRQYLSV